VRVVVSIGTLSLLNLLVRRALAPMPHRFYRVVSDKHWQDIAGTSRLTPTNEIWPPYDGGRVYLYPANVPRKYLDSRADELCDQGWGPAHLLEIEVPDSLSHRLERDASFAGYEHARVFRGNIDPEDGCVIKHLEQMDCRSSA